VLLNIARHIPRPACRQSRPQICKTTLKSGEPIITINPVSRTLLAKEDPITHKILPGYCFPWGVSEGEKCWDLLTRVLSRQRGRGVAFLDWADDSCSTDNFTDIKPLITIRSQLAPDLVYIKPSDGSTVTVSQATTLNTAIDVDLQGDHRYVGDSLQLITNDSSGVDYLETQGEPIEVLVTLSGKDSTLEKRWSDADETTFKGISSSVWWQRTSTRWRHIFSTLEHSSYLGFQSRRWQRWCQDQLLLRLPRQWY